MNTRENVPDHDTIDQVLTQSLEQVKVTPHVAGQGPELTWQQLLRILLLGNNRGSDTAVLYDYIDRPMRVEFVGEMTVITYTKKRKEWMKAQQIEPTCSICQDAYRVGDRLLYLVCQHMYHKRCLWPWIEQHNTCPNCRCVLDDNFYLDMHFTKNGLRLHGIGIRLEEIFDQVERLENKRGRCWIFNMDRELKSQIAEFKVELLQIVNEIGTMEIDEKWLCFRTWVLKKIQILHEFLQKSLKSF